MAKAPLIAETLGERIWEAMQANSWNKAELLRLLADRGLKTQRKTLDDWIANKAGIKVANLTVLAEVLGYKLDELTRTEIKPDPNVALSRVQLDDFLDSINVTPAARDYILTDVESYPPAGGPTRSHVMAILRAYGADKHRTVNASADEEAARAGAKPVTPEALRDAVKQTKQDDERHSTVPPARNSSNDE